MQDTQDGFFPNEPLTSARGAYWDETEAAPMTTSSTTTTPTRLNEINLDSLSERGKAIKLMIVDEMSDGYDLGTIAKELGRSPSWVSERLTELRHEIELQQSGFFPLTDQEFEALKLSIAEYGVQNPILVGEHMLLDGRHRWLASKELGLKDVPALFIQGLGVDAEREVAIAVNSARRQLTSRQKNALVRAELTRDATRSDRRIAAICGVTHPTVGSVRLEMVAEQTNDPSVEDVADVHEDVARRLLPEKRVDTLGRERTVVPREPKENVPTFHGYVTCSHGQVHRLVKEGTEYRLEVDQD